MPDRGRSGRILPVLLFLLGGCAGQGDRVDAPADSPAGISDARTSAVVRTGADRLAGEAFGTLSGHRTGLIVNHTARVNGRHLADLVHESSAVELTALFGPEHGLRGEAAAGERIDDGVDDATGVPVYSLYGETRRPTPGMLRNVDVLVFDIQDVGARFYTYISTMGLAMQSAAEHGLRFVVLDRPNPLGGAVTEGFVLDTSFTSFVGRYPIPQRHGMTVGELARMIRGEGWLPGVDSLRLEIVELERWDRRMLWPETGLEWIPPSPNLPTFESALLYPGTALFEATVASEGRGTPLPFLTIGAPWMAADEVIDRMPLASLRGLALTSSRETPVEISGAAVDPKFEDSPIETIRIDVTAAESVRAVEFGIDLVRTVYETAPDSVRRRFFDERWMRLLAGTDRLQPMIEEGRTAADIRGEWTDELKRFDDRRAAYLLYR